MIETLLDMQQKYVPVNRKLYWAILGVLFLFIVLVLVIVIYSTSIKDHDSGNAHCSGHDQCPSFKSCVLGKCGDPCEGVCGNNTLCTVTHHIPACACKDGFTGNPFIGCALKETTGVWPPTNGKKRFYEADNVLADWTGAFMYCLRNNSRLASIDNMDEFEEIRNFIHQNEQSRRIYWTSGSDAGSEGHFLWASTGRDLALSSDMWMHGEPNNDGENGHCVDIHIRSLDVGGFGLNDRPCKDKCYIICEYYK